MSARRPYDNRGRFVSLDCPLPECGGGRLEYEDADWGTPHWRCNGLADPNDPNKPLDACSFAHFDGEAFSSQGEQER